MIPKSSKPIPKSRISVFLYLLLAWVCAFFIFSLCDTSETWNCLISRGFLQFIPRIIVMTTLLCGSCFLALELHRCFFGQDKKKFLNSTFGFICLIQLPILVFLILPASIFDSTHGGVVFSEKDVYSGPIFWLFYFAWVVLSFFVVFLWSIITKKNKSFFKNFIYSFAILMVASCVCVIQYFIFCWDWSILLLILVCVSLTDIFGYIFGINFGKHKISKKISPNKSWEGCLAGVLLSSAITLGLAFLLFYFKDTNEHVSLNNNHDFKLAWYYFSKILNSYKKGWGLPYFGACLVLTIVIILISVLGVFGDLFFSLIKRLNAIKDYGSFLKTHGGLLDRFDSLIFVLFCVSVVIVISGFITSMIAICHNGIYF